jgi:hypothetical protein
LVKHGDDQPEWWTKSGWTIVTVLLGLLVGELLWIALMVWFADILRGA